MTVRVRERDGIEIELASGTTVLADATRPTGSINVTSHAHGDHLFDEAPDPIVCSELTAALAAVRRPDVDLERTTHPAVELLDAGHVPGSRATLVTDPTDGTRVLYTGDVSTRDRLFQEGFDPVPADVLIVEATYGESTFQLPPQATVEREIREWLNDTLDRPVLLFGYALGRAQELQWLVGQSDRDRLFVTDAIADLNAPIEAALDVSFDAVRYDRDAELAPGDALVLPTQTSGLAFVDRLQTDTGALKAGFSGWAVEESFRYRGGYDETFALSDHCGYDELLALVDAVAPDRVYTQHGSASALASTLVGEGYDAQALVENQTSLGDFG
jgi:putative mRNA 3-end processing factor